MSDWKKKALLFLTSQAITLFGSSVVQFALVWFVTLKTSSGFWVSMLTVCAYVPQFLISFIAGVWADRYSRKKLIIFSDLAIAVTTLILAVELPFLKEDTLLLTVLMIVSAIRSVGTGIQTPAVSAVLPQIVPEEKLMKLNGVNSAVQSVVQFAAPAAAGAVLTVSTLGASLMIDIASAAAGIGILCAVSIPKQMRKDEETQTSAYSDLKIGIKYTFSDSFLGKLLPLFGIFIFLCVPAGFLATLFVSRRYGDSYMYLTVVELVGFAGMVGGGVLIGTWGGFKNRMKTLLVGLLFFGALAIGMGAVNNFIVYLSLMLIYGVALTLVQTAVTTLIQEKASMEMQGRVFGLSGAMYSGFLPLGMAVFGPMSDAIDMKWIMIGSGAALIIMSLCVINSRKFYNEGLKEALI